MPDKEIMSFSIIITGTAGAAGNKLNITTSIIEVIVFTRQMFFFKHSKIMTVQIQP